MRDGGAYGCAVPRAYANLNPGLELKRSRTLAVIAFKYKCFQFSFKAVCAGFQSNVVG